MGKLSVRRRPWPPRPPDASAGGQRQGQPCRLGRTCLKWASNGERTALDLSLVMERLAEVDQEVAATYQNTADLRACPTVS